MDANREDQALDALSPRAHLKPSRVRLGIGASVALVILALVVTVAVTLMTPSGQSQAGPAVTANTGPDGLSTGEPSSNGGTTQIYVHVLGAVHNPGLFELGSGARVIDAIASAGGFLAEANRGGVNLAREISDGEQIVVPKIGEIPPASSPTGVAARGKVNINRASSSELQSLPHVGPAMADRILDWRKDNGHFSSIDDLLNVSGIGQKTFESLKDLVTI